MNTIKERTTNMSLNLPRHKYEPFFLKIIKDFIEFHKISEDIPFPEGNLSPHMIFSYISELMAYSMGYEKREELIKELEEYKNSI